MATSGAGGDLLAFQPPMRSLVCHKALRAGNRRQDRNRPFTATCALQELPCRLPLKMPTLVRRSFS
jgi:hypothetical protein